jgi:hypothetical protein
MKQAKLLRPVEVAKMTAEEAMAVERPGRPQAMIVKTQVEMEVALVAMEVVATAVVAMEAVEVGETTESVVMVVAARVMQRTGIVPAATTSPVVTEINKSRQRLLMTQIPWYVLRFNEMVRATRSAALNTLMVANLVLSIATPCVAAKMLTAVVSATCFMSPSFGSGGTSGRKRKGRNVAQGKAKKMLLMKLPSRQLFQQRRGRPTKNLNRQTRGLQRKDHILHVPFRKDHPPKYINKTIGQLLQS